MQHFITQYGYIAVFLLMLAESACIPVPSEVIMMFGGALAGGAFATGAGATHPLLAGIVAAGVLGNVAGSYIAWGVGKYAGQAAIHRWGRKIGIRDHEIDRATAWFERHGPVAVLVGRVIPVIRTFISLPAGFADMPAGKFGLYTTLGCIPWTAALAIAGYALGANWQNVANDFHGPTYAIAGIVVVGLVVGFILYRRRRRAAEASGSGGPSGVGGAPGVGGTSGVGGASGVGGVSNSGSYPGNAGYPTNNAGHRTNVDNSDPSGDGAPYGGRGSGGGAQPDDTRFDGTRPVNSPWGPANQQYR
jgi:membrane protein DedA with SNARE-associated domain